MCLSITSGLLIIKMPNDPDTIFRTLADPTRRAIFERLCRDGEQTVSALTARAGVSRGAQEHYYPKKIDLIGAATRFAMDEAVHHAQSLAASAAHSPDPIAKFLAGLFLVLFLVFLIVGLSAAKRIAS